MITPATEKNQSHQQGRTKLQDASGAWVTDVIEISNAQNKYSTEVSPKNDDAIHKKNVGIVCGTCGIVSCTLVLFEMNQIRMNQKKEEGLDAIPSKLANACAEHPANTLTHSSTLAIEASTFVPVKMKAAGIILIHKSKGSTSCWSTTVLLLSYQLYQCFLEKSRQKQYYI